MTEEHNAPIRKLRLEFQSLHIDRPDEDLLKAYRAIIVKDGKAARSSVRAGSSHEAHDHAQGKPKSSDDEKRA